MVRTCNPSFTSTEFGGESTFAWHNYKLVFTLKTVCTLAFTLKNFSTLVFSLKTFCTQYAYCENFLNIVFTPETFCTLCLLQKISAHLCLLQKLSAHLCLLRKPHCCANSTASLPMVLAAKRHKKASLPLHIPAYTPHTSQ